MKNVQVARLRVPVLSGLHQDTHSEAAVDIDAPGGGVGSGEAPSGGALAATEQAVRFPQARNNAMAAQLAARRLRVRAKLLVERARQARLERRSAGVLTAARQSPKAALELEPTAD